MRLIDILLEDRNYTKTNGSISRAHVHPLTGAHVMGGTADRFYDLYRLSMQLAKADGVKKPSYDSESWIGRNNTAHPYTKQEADMLKHAYAATGVTWTDKMFPNPDNRSEELPDTHTISPVASGWKKKSPRSDK